MELGVRVCVPDSRHEVAFVGVELEVDGDAAGAVVNTCHGAVIERRNTKLSSDPVARFRRLPLCHGSEEEDRPAWTGAAAPAVIHRCQVARPVRADRARTCSVEDGPRLRCHALCVRHPIPAGIAVYATGGVRSRRTRAVQPVIRARRDRAACQPHRHQ